MDRSVNTRALSLRPRQRLIAVSDIHGNLRLFNKLLDQVRYTPGSDVLVLAGDLIEKGPQSLDTLRFIMKLSKTPGVYALMGNCDFVCKNIWHRYNLRFLHQVLLQRKASILHEMADALHVSIDAHTDMERFCDLLHQHYAEELSWVDALPQVVHGDNACHSAVLVKDDGKIVMGLFHLFEKHVGMYAFGHEIRRPYGLLKYDLLGLVLEPEEILYVKHSDDLVNGLVADGIF